MLAHSCVHAHKATVEHSVKLILITARQTLAKMEVFVRRDVGQRLLVVVLLALLVRTAVKTTPHTQPVWKISATVMVLVWRSLAPTLVAAVLLASVENTVNLTSTTAQ